MTNREVADITSDYFPGRPLGGSSSVSSSVLHDPASQSTSFFSFNSPAGSQPGFRPEQPTRKGSCVWVYVVYIYIKSVWAIMWVTLSSDL